MASPFDPFRLGPVTLRNRIVKAATFEGVMPRGAVTDELVDFHRRVARGGAAMTTVAYCAVMPSGRVQRHTLVMDAATARSLRRLTDAVHEAGAAVAAQLGHAGLVADTRSNRMPTLAPSTRLSAPARTLVRRATEVQLDEVVRAFASAATHAADAGFDAVELHLGHGYLLSSFLSPQLNRRRDRFGGDLEGRARFPRRVVAAVRDAVGGRLAVTAKVNMTDGVPNGLQLEEAVAFARMLDADGHLDALQLTAGSSLQNAMYFFRGDVPLESMIATQPRVAGWGLRLLNRRMFPRYPFEEAFLAPLAGQVRAAVDMPLMLLGGINRLDTIETALDDGFELVAMARALLRDPDLVESFRSGDRVESRCTHCNECMPTIYDGTRCVLVEGTGSTGAGALSPGRRPPAGGPRPRGHRPR